MGTDILIGFWKVYISQPSRAPQDTRCFGVAERLAVTLSFQVNRYEHGHHHSCFLFSIGNVVIVSYLAYFTPEAVG